MMLASEEAAEILLHLESWKELEVASGEPMKTYRNAVIVDAQSIQSRSVMGDLTDHARFQTQLIFDRYLLCYRQGSEKENQELVDCFFGYIAAQYESLIDVERNLENMAVLFRILDRSMSLCPNDVIVDLGCGTGLAATARDRLGIEARLIGVDICPEMRSAASIRGLEAVAPWEVATGCSRGFNAVICSYVLHLIQEPSSLRIVWNHLPKGGVLVGNLHDAGRDKVEGMFQGLGASCQLELEELKGMDKHGGYVAFRK